MKNKKGLFTLFGLIACAGAITIGCLSTKEFIGSTDSVSAVSLPSYSSDNDLHPNIPYYFYLDTSRIKSGDYNNLPDYNLLTFGGLTDGEFDFYPSLTSTNGGEIYNTISMWTEAFNEGPSYVGVVLHFDLFNSNYSTNVFKLYHFVLADDDFYRYSFDFEYNGLDIFDGSHYVLYDNQVGDDKIALCNFISCFGVNSPRDITYNVSTTRPSEFGFGYFPGHTRWFYDLTKYSNYNSYHNVPAFNVDFTYLDVSYARYFLYRMYSGLLNFNGSIYTDMYFVFESPYFIDYVFDDIDGDIIPQDISLNGGLYRGETMYAIQHNGYVDYAVIFHNSYNENWVYASSINDYSITINGDITYSHNLRGYNWIFYNTLTFTAYFTLLSNGSSNVLLPFDYYSYWSGLSDSVYYGFYYYYVPNGGSDTDFALYSSFSLLSLSFSGLIGLLSFSILPGITLGMLVSIPILITILLFVIKLFKR